MLTILSSVISLAALAVLVEVEVEKIKLTPRSYFLLNCVVVCLVALSVILYNKGI